MEALVSVNVFPKYQNSQLESDDLSDYAVKRKNGTIGLKITKAKSKVELDNAKTELVNANAEIDQLRNLIAQLQGKADSLENTTADLQRQISVALGNSSGRVEIGKIKFVDKGLGRGDVYVDSCKVGNSTNSPWGEVYPYIKEGGLIYMNEVNGSKNSYLTDCGSFYAVPIFQTREVCYGGCRERVLLTAVLKIYK